MARVTCYYYLKESGKSPVKEFIDSLDVTSQKKYFFVKLLLEEFGFKLSHPYVKYIGNSIFELRCSGKEGEVRVLYFFFERHIVVFTNGFIKKSGRTPRVEIRIAIERRKKFMISKGGNYHDTN